MADGANPWSLSSCDAFAAAFSPAPYNLRPDAMCPCAGSSETGTISIRRRGNAQLGSQSGRGVLSMSALSHCVVRVDQENSLTSLTLQVGLMAEFWFSRPPLENTGKIAPNREKVNFYFLVVVFEFWTFFLKNLKNPVSGRCLGF